MSAFRQKHRIQEKGLPAGHWRILQNRSIRGEVLVALRRIGEAEKVLVDSCEGLRDRLGEKSGYTRRARKAIEAFYETTGRPEMAVSYSSSR